MNKVIIIALVFVTIGFCDNMMMRAGSDAPTNLVSSAFALYYDSAKISLQKLLKSANMTCTEISSIEVIQYDLNYASMPLVGIAAELNINKGSCKIEVLATYNAAGKTLDISKIYKEYPPFKKLADLPK